MMKARAGSKIYKGVEIPEKAKIIIDKKGEECYVTGVELDCENKWIATVRYFLRKENEFMKYPAINVLKML